MKKFDSIKPLDRRSNFELLRIFSMILIVAGHVIVHVYSLTSIYSGSTLSELWDATTVYSLLSINCITVIGVNLFVLITGYFGLTIKWKTILNLWFICFFYVVLDLISCRCFGLRVGGGHILSCLLISHPSGLWFIKAYLMLVLLSPLINYVINRIGPKRLSAVVLLLVVINCFFGWLLYNDVNNNGYNTNQLIFIYVIGAWIRQHNLSDLISAKKLLALYFICLMLLIGLVLTVFSKFSPAATWHFYNYNSPLVIIMAIAVFLLFSKLSFSSPLVNRLAKSMIAVYMVQESVFGYSIYDRLQNYLLSPSSSVLAVPLYIFLVFAVALILDIVRLWLSGKILPTLSNFLDKKFNIKDLSIN